MAKKDRDWEAVFNSWAQAPSASEQERCDNAIKMIRKAIDKSEKLNRRQIKVFAQGSYRNRVNVRKDSDVDVGVMLHQYFLSEYPTGKGHADFGNYAADYTFQEFKNELGEALVDFFGQSSVTRGRKAFDIKATSYRVEADVVPLFEFRHYWDAGDFRAGVALIPDGNGARIENYPERLLSDWPSTPLHYENGVSKNNETNRSFKGVVRILKCLRNEMADEGVATADPIPGYLLECLAWNTPSHLYRASNWMEMIREILVHTYSITESSVAFDQHFEVDAIKYLFHGSQPWTRAQAHSFIADAWKQIGYE